MKQLGDITKIRGREAPTVDIITGGSPCQDLSVAGKRAGLAGNRSGLFMEQIRIIKEMRDKCARMGADDIWPRYMVWENVPGAFSSNNGEDFRAVLEETARIADKTAAIPRPEGGRWSTSGCIMADGWSIAWRVHDAQFWGVPQRRKRIALVADFDGQSAPEILFERESVCGDLEKSGEQGQRTAADVKRSSDETISFLERAGCAGGVKEYSYSTNEPERCQHSTINQCYNISGEDIEGTLDASYYKGIGARSGKEREVKAFGISAYESNAMKSNNPHSGIYEADTARTLDNNGGSPACNQGGIAICYSGANITSKVNASNPQIGDPCHTINTDSRNYLVTDARGNGDGEIVSTITGDHQSRITDYTAIVLNDQGGAQMSVTKDRTATLRAQEHGHPPITYQDVKCYGIDRAAYNQGTNAQYDFSVEEDKIATCVAKGPGAVCSVDCRNGSENEACNGTLQAKANGGISYNLNNVCRVNATVRRLTPLECERLQGYPSGWTDIGDWIDSKGKLHRSEQNDSARYKALGNSIALPFWQWLAERICKQYDQQPTMASLFDGIGGFPLVFSRAGAVPVWSSEIEEFPIAVTKVRFREVQHD